MNARAGFRRLQRIKGEYNPEGQRDLFNYLYENYRDCETAAARIRWLRRNERRFWSASLSDPATMNKIGPAIAEKMLADEKDEKDKNKTSKMAQVAEIILGAALDFDNIRWQAMAAIFNDPTLCGSTWSNPATLWA